MFVVAEVLHLAGPAEVDDGLRFLDFNTEGVVRGGGVV